MGQWPLFSPFNTKRESWRPTFLVSAFPYFAVDLTAVLAAPDSAKKGSQPVIVSCLDSLKSAHETPHPASLRDLPVAELKTFDISWLYVLYHIGILVNTKV